MTRFAFMHGVLFSLYFISYQCEGKFTSPPDGTKYIFLPGKTVKIKWKFDDAISTLKDRSWSFTSSDGSLTESLAEILRNGSTDILTKLFEVDIERPATLVLKNVNQSYNGLYQLAFRSSKVFISDVMVSIAKKPTAMVNCPSRNEVNEGGNFTCVCRSVGGNPDNNVTWFKNGVQFGETRKENNILNLTDVDETDNGAYTCVAESYANEAFKDEKSIVVLVNFKPEDTSIVFTPNPATLGKSVTIKCESRAFPVPSYTIIHNKTLVITETVISRVNWTHAGKYNCTATNNLGSDSHSGFLNVTEQEPPTTSPPTTTSPSPATSTSKTASTTMKDKAFCNDISCGTEWYIVVVSLVSGVIIGIIVSYFAWCSHRRWFRNRKPEQNPEAQTNEVDTTYQELDLTKMNKEDNYQSLRVNAASNDAANDDDSTYTKLSKTRDVENYQSLT